MSVEGYERRTKKHSDVSWGDWVDVGNVLLAHVTGLDLGENDFQVRSYDDKDQRGEESSVLTINNLGLALEVLNSSSIRATWTEPPDTAAPSVPTMDAATDVTTSSITWNWEASTDDTAVTGYDLQVATDSGFTTDLRTINLGNVLTYIDTGLDAGQIYYARVRAHDAVPNNSAYSTSVNETTSAVGFLPSDLTGLKNWYRRSIGQWQDAGKTTPATGTDLVGAWEDQSGNGNDMTGSGSLRPTLSSGGVHFDGGTRLLKTSASQVLKPVTFFCKVNFDSVAGFQSLLESTTNSLLISAIGSTLRLSKQSNSTIANASTSLTSGSDLRIIVTYDGSGNYAFYINGSSAGSGTNNQTLGNNYLCMSSETLGQALAAVIKEWGLYDNALTGTDVTDLDTYLTSV